MDRSTAVRILRVNHGGEHGAIRIYRGQIAMAAFRCPELLPFLRETLGHEIEHLARFRALMSTRGGRPCRTMWLWGAGGLVLGLATGLAGRRAVLVCTEAVERTVHRHLDEQVRHVGASDLELSTTLLDIQRQERAHLGHARRERGPRTAWMRTLDRTIAAATETLIWLSTQGDSARLAREMKAGP